MESVRAHSLELRTPFLRTAVAFKPIGDAFQFGCRRRGACQVRGPISFRRLTTNPQAVASTDHTKPCPAMVMAAINVSWHPGARRIMLVPIDCQCIKRHLLRRVNPPNAQQPTKLVAAALTSSLEIPGSVLCELTQCFSYLHHLHALPGTVRSDR